MHGHVFKIYTVCVYLYIHNTYIQYKHVYNVKSTFILDVINRLTALIYISKNSLHTQKKGYKIG